MFSMTSLGAQIDESINNGRGPYVFKISGQLYHWIGSLCPTEGEPPRFLQLYIYDTDNEVENHMSHFGRDNNRLRRDIFEGLIDLLNAHNALKFEDMHILNFKVWSCNVIDAHEYELPTGYMLGAIVYKTGPKTDMDYDVVLEERLGYPRRVNKLHLSYMSLQFPLLFIYGRDGYSKELRMVDDSVRISKEEDIDVYISAELPSEDVDAESYRISGCTTMNTDGRHLTYLNFPYEFVWYANGKYWRRRRIRNKSSIGRLTYVHPATPDLFYQRMLLCHQKGCTSFPGIRTVNDIVYPTCRAAREALGLLKDDQEWEIMLQEVALIATPAELRTLLAHILFLPSKTFLWKTIIYALRSEGMIVLAVASSDRTLRDLFDELNHLYGGKTVMLGGDFRQTLPVKKSATRDEIIQSSVDKSYICRHFKMHYLTENMRLNNQGLHEVDRDRVSVFAHWLLDVGNGHIGTPNESDPENTSWVGIPDDYCIPDEWSIKLNKFHL
ncbi:DNA helicase [Tanacetum coccineum]